MKLYHNAEGAEIMPRSKPRRRQEGNLFVHTISREGWLSVESMEVQKCNCGKLATYHSRLLSIDPGTVIMSCNDCK